jgi:hypothetical protein
VPKLWVPLFSNDIEAPAETHGTAQLMGTVTPGLILIAGRKRVGVVPEEEVLLTGTAR